MMPKIVIVQNFATLLISGDSKSPLQQPDTNAVERELHVLL